MTVHKMLRLAQVIEKVGLKKSAIYDLAKNGSPRFPAAVKLGRASRWVEAEIDEWLNACIEKRQ